MNDEKQVMAVGDEKVLIFTERADWFWRGADWTSHMSSVGAFKTKDAALDSARKYFTRGSDNLRGGRP